MLTMAPSKKHESLRGDKLEREAQEDIRQQKIAEAVAGPERVRADVNRALEAQRTGWSR